MPRLHLRRFARGERINRWRAGEVREVGIADVTVSADFYSLGDRSGAPSNLLVDQILEEVENLAAPVIDTLLATETLPPPNSGEREIVASFVAQLACRTRRDRREFETFAEAFLRVRLANSNRETAVTILEAAGQVRSPVFERFRAGAIALSELEIELQPARMYS